MAVESVMARVRRQEQGMLFAGHRQHDGKSNIKCLSPAAQADFARTFSCVRAPRFVGRIEDRARSPECVLSFPSFGRYNPTDDRRDLRIIPSGAGIQAVQSGSRCRVHAWRRDGARADFQDLDLRDHRGDCFDVVAPSSRPLNKVGL